MNKIIILSVCAVLLAPSLVQAGPVVRGGESISVEAAQMIKGDFYGVASSVDMSGSAENDVYIGGGKITSNGWVGEDLSIIGGTVQVHGDIGDDLRVIGGDVVLASSVRGDVVVLGGTLTILSTASVGGDVLFWGGDLSIAGPVVGGVHGRSETIRVDALIGGDIEYTASRALTLGDNAHIKGSLTYSGSRDMVRAQNAVVDGDVRRTEAKNEQPVNPLTSYFYMLASLLFTVLMFFFLARRHVTEFTRTSTTMPGIFGLIGLGTIIVTPIVALVLLVSVIGSAVGIALLAGYVVLLVCSFVLGIMTLGYIFEQKVLHIKEITIRTPITGAILLSILALIPNIFPFLLLAIVSVSCGVVMHALYHSVRK